MAIQASTFVDACLRRGFDFFAGVPCSFVKPLINEVITRPGLTYVGAASEGEAVGITAGAWIGGRRTVSMCQNSGLGNMVNPLTSLNRPFGIPTLLLTTWRGQPGLADEPQHEQMGRIMFRLIECLELPWAECPDQDADIDAALDMATNEMDRTRKPFVLVMRKGTMLTRADIPAAAPRPLTGLARDDRRGSRPPSRTEAIRAARAAWPSAAPIVATTGMTGRELFSIDDRPTHLYTVGSMGCASAIGLGLSVSRRGSDDGDRRTLVLDGDGAALMKLGSLATIGHESPERLVHVVLNNMTHDSTGGQHTAASNVNFAAVAVACGYASGTRVDDCAGLTEAIQRGLDVPGPHLIEASIAPGSPKDIGRPTITPREAIDRMRGALGTLVSPARPGKSSSAP